MDKYLNPEEQEETKTEEISDPSTDYKVKLFANVEQAIPVVEEEENSADKILEKKLTSSDKVSGFSKKLTKYNIEDVINKNFYYRKAKISGREKNDDEENEKDDKKMMYSKFKYDLVRYYFHANTKEWEEKNFFEKIVYICIDKPFDLFRNLTIPPFEQSKWNRDYFVLQPICISLFFSYIFGISYKNNIPWVIIYYIAVIALCILLYRTTYRGSLPSYEILLLILSLVMSIIEIYIFSKILMDMITVIRMLLPMDIPEAFMTMSVLAIGNSLPDFIVNCSLSKTGYAEMALTGSIGAPVFGMLFGFGLSLIKKSIQKKFELIDFDLFAKGKNSKMSVENYIIIVALGGIYAMIIVFMVIGVIQKFQLTRLVSFIGFSVFIVYFGVIIYVTFIMNI